MKKLFLFAAFFLGLGGAVAMAEDNRIDLMRPDAPDLAVFGPDRIGVRSIELVNPGQVDILRIETGKPLPRYDRELTVEVWYPADVPDGTAASAYDGVLLRDGKTAVTLHGKAVREAEPKKGVQYPLVILSHGYPGNRFLLSHLAENLASKGYVVASIDHAESTYDDQQKFGSTLVNRPLDQRFVLDEMARLSGQGGGFLSGLVDTANTAVVGYSMGGYGALITAGGGVTEASTKLEWGAPEGTLRVHLAGSESLEKLVDPRVKAIVAFAPWGMERGFWDEKGLADIRKPVLFIAGSVDDVSGYENGVKKIFDQSVNADRYLLTFENANHNAAAPIPAPVESWNKVDSLPFVPFDHYADPVWDTVRMNNIAQHFVTAFLGRHLKGDAGMDAYLDLVEQSGDGVWAVNEDGSLKPEHSYWKGFQNRTARGLSLAHETPAQ